MKNENQALELHGSDHLPECEMSDTNDWYCCSECDPGKVPTWERRCICHRLRACEQRVMTEALQQAKAREANGITWALATARALGAAETAVADAAKDTYCDNAPCWGSESYLAAIRALKEKP